MTTPHQERAKEQYDVIVIGAGLSGLMCADTILSSFNKEQKQIHNGAPPSVLILETNDRCGGRTKTIQSSVKPGVFIDEGGMWLGKTHELMLELCNRFNVKLYEQFSEGDDVVVRSDGQRFVGGIPEIEGDDAQATTNDSENKPEDDFLSPDADSSPASLTQIELDPVLDALMKAQHEIDEQVIPTILELSDEISLEEPWTYHHSREMDAYSVEAYFRTLGSSNYALEFLNDISRALLGCEASQVSLMFFVWSIKSGGGWQYTMSTKGGAQEKRLLGGAQQICDGLLKSVRSHANAQVLFHRRVIRVDRNENGKLLVTVLDASETDRTPAVAMFTCNKLVCSANASVFVREVAFSPRLPLDVEQFAQRTFRGSYGKALVAFKSPFWRDLGLSGTMTNSSDHAFVCSAMDYCIPSSTTNENYYALACFFSGDPGLRAARMTEWERRNGVMKDLSMLTKVPLEKLESEFLEYHDYLWHSDAIAQGCSGVIFGPGQFAEFAPGRVFHPARQPFHGGSLYFVGTDVCTRFVGYMEGAVLSGREIGRKVVENLARSQATQAGSSRL